MMNLLLNFQVLNFNIKTTSLSFKLKTNLKIFVILTHFRLKSFVKKNYDKYCIPIFKHSDRQIKISST